MCEGQCARIIANDDGRTGAVRSKLWKRLKLTHLSEFINSSLSPRNILTFQTARLDILRRHLRVVRFGDAAVDLVSQDGRHTTTAWIATQFSQRQLLLCVVGSLEIS